MLEHGIIPNFTSVFLEPFYFGLCWETWGTEWMKEILCKPLRFAIFRQDLRNSGSCDEYRLQEKDFGSAVRKMEYSQRISGSDPA